MTLVVVAISIVALYVVVGHTLIPVALAILLSFALGPIAIDIVGAGVWVVLHPLS